MLDQVLVGGATSLINLCLHALLIAGCSHSTARLTATRFRMPSVLQHSIVIAATGALLVAGHLIEVLLWSWTYALVHAVPANTDLLYFAFGNYTTLGYGDVLPLPGWRLLGPMTALNGILLIGWSTALIVEVLRRARASDGAAKY